MINVGIFGLGRISHVADSLSVGYGYKLTHLSTIQSLRGFKTIYGVDINTKARSLFESRNKIPAYDLTETHSLRKRADLIVIATPTSSHLETLRFALELKPKLILLEKPVEFSLKKAREVQMIQQKSNIPIIVNYQRNYHPKFVQLRDRIHQDINVPGTRITTIFSGDWLNIGSHCVSLVQFLLGDGQVDYSYTKASDDLVVLASNRGKGYIVNMDFPSHNLFSMRINNRKFHIEYDSEQSYWKVFSLKKNTAYPNDPYWGSDERLEYIEQSDGLKHVYLNIARYFSKKKSSLTTLESAIRTMEIMKPWC